MDQGYVTGLLDEQRRKAWASLARYKFLMFGYHAAQWVVLNQAFKTKRSNPFKELVVFARGNLPRPTDG